MFRCSRKFSLRTSQKVVFHLLSKRIFQKLVGFAFRLFSLACFAAMQISWNKRIIFLYIRSPHSFFSGGGGPQVDEVTRLGGVTRLSM